MIIRLLWLSSYVFSLYCAYNIMRLRQRLLVFLLAFLPCIGFFLAILMKARCPFCKELKFASAAICPRCGRTIDSGRVDVTGMRDKTKQNPTPTSMALKQDSAYCIRGSIAAIVCLLLMFVGTALDGDTNAATNRRSDSLPPRTVSTTRVSNGYEQKTPSNSSIQEENQRKENWFFSSDISEIDDSVQYFASCSAQGKVKKGLSEGVPTFMVRFSEGKTTMYISYPFFLSTQEMPVTFRFGDYEASTEQCGISTDHKAVFLPYSFADFLDTIDEVSKIVVRLTPYGESPVTSVFDVAGFRDVVPQKAIDAMLSGDKH